jgi:histidyl-tRNA synthetase
MYVPKLGTPFKRYHMGPVWRGENTAHGRFREFWQCDFDTIGTTSNAADIEIVLVINDLMTALGFERFTIRVNNRLALNGLLQELGLRDRAKPVLIAIDKLPKIGRAAVQAEIEKAGVGKDQAGRVLDLVATEGSNAEILGRLKQSFGSNPLVAEAVNQLGELLRVAQAAGVPADRVQLDVSIARGLDYYTGTIYETTLSDKPDIGSVCSGGRYDNLAALYTKQQLPGVGASLGLDRLLAAMEELNMLSATATPAPVLIVQFAADRLGDYQKMGRTLRAQGIGVEVYPEAKKLGAQLKYAENRGFRVALIAGPDEFAADSWKVKDLLKREEKAVKSGEIVEVIRAILAT